MVIGTLKLQVVQLLPDFGIASVQLSFKMHRESLVGIACLLQRAAHFTYFHVSILLD
jgi:hypothetical protein